ncbi:hypothetical protein [Burkholderia contaminans]|uniref:hypothetical protein n=1 Tax=Burkholderia contaminans TaxID=488447 RepID=UPI003D665F84
MNRSDSSFRRLVNPALIQLPDFYSSLEFRRFVMSAARLVSTAGLARHGSSKLPVSTDPVH